MHKQASCILGDHQAKITAKFIQQLNTEKKNHWWHYAYLNASTMSIVLTGLSSTFSSSDTPSNGGFAAISTETGPFSIHYSIKQKHFSWKIEHRTAIKRLWCLKSLTIQLPSHLLPTRFHQKPPCRGKNQIRARHLW